MPEQKEKNTSTKPKAIPPSTPSQARVSLTREERVTRSPSDREIRTRLTELEITGDGPTIQSFLSQYSNPRVQPDSEEPTLTAVPISPEPDITFELNDESAYDEFFRIAKENATDKKQLAKEIAKLVTAGALSIIPANGSRLCGHNAMSKLFDFFNLDNATFEVIMNDMTGATAGLANFTLYGKNNYAFFGFITGKKINILNPRQTKLWQWSIAIGLSASAALAAVSVGAVNASGEENLSTLHRAFSAGSTTLFNIPLHVMYAINLFMRFLLPNEQALYVKALHTLSNQLSLKNTEEQISLIKAVIESVNHESNNHKKILENLYNPSISNAEKCHLAYRYLIQLPTNEQFEISNALMRELHIELESPKATLALHLVYGMAGTIGLLGCLCGNYYAQKQGDEALLGMFGVDDNTSETVADWTTWYPFIAKALMYISSQMALVDGLRDLPTFLKKIPNLPWDIKATVAISAVASGICFGLSGTCYMIDSAEALSEILGVSPYWLVLVANYSATSVNSLGFAYLTHRLLKDLAVGIYDGIAKLMGNETPRHIAGDYDLPAFVATTERKANSLFLSPDERSTFQFFTQSESPTTETTRLVNETTDKQPNCLERICSWVPSIGL